MSSLGIFDKETKTYKKVADLSKPAVIDSAMSDNSTNAVQNKVVKSYVDTRTTFDSSMSDTSTNAVQNNVVKSYVDGTFKQKSIAYMPGDGETLYCRLCTIKINKANINTPIEITVQERGRGTLDRLTVLFAQSDSIDPDLASFKVFGEFVGWYISKIDASTWVIYGSKNDPWGSIRVVDYNGIDGITVTWDVTGVRSLPDIVIEAKWGGKVSHALKADSAISASKVNGHTVKSNVPENAVFTDTMYDDTDIRAELNKKINTADIQDNIESTGTTSPLSANQGRILNEKITEHTSNGNIHVTIADKSNWNGYATEIEQNKTDISTVKTDIQNLQTQDNVLSSRIDNLSAADAELADIRVGADGNTYDNAGTAVRTQVGELKEDKVDKDEILNAGIKSFSYIPMFGGEFTVTTAYEEGYISPHSRASVTGIISKHYTYRITVNGEIYELPCGLHSISKGTNLEIFEYLGNLSLYTEDTSFSTYDNRNVPFCIIPGLDNNSSIDVFTQSPNMTSILVEQIQKEQIVFPKSLVWGDDYCPIEFKRNDGVYNGVSIGLNLLKNTRGTFAIGYGNKVDGDFSTALGIICEISGTGSYAEGAQTTVSGNFSHAEGNQTTASGDRSHAEGYKTIASGNNSHVEGQRCITNGGMSHSGGNRSEANERASFAHGNFVKATRPSQFVVGYGNDPQEDSIFEIGNGLDVNGQPVNAGNTEPATRQNAFRVTQSGVAVVKTGLQIGNTIINEEQLQKIIALIN